MVAASVSMEPSLADGKERGFAGVKRRGIGKAKGPPSDLKLTDQQQQSAGIIAKAAAKGPVSGQTRDIATTATHPDAVKRGQDSAAGPRSSSIADKAQHENPNRWGQALATVSKGTSSPPEPQSSATVGSMPAPRQQQGGKQKPSSETSKPDQAQNTGRGQQQQISRTGSHEKDKAAHSVPAAASNGSSVPAASGRGGKRGGSSPRNSSAPAAAPSSAAASAQQQARDSSPAAPPRMSYSAVISQQSRSMSKLGAPRAAAPAKPAAPQEPFPPLSQDAASSKAANSSTSSGAAATAAAAVAPAAQSSPPKAEAASSKGGEKANAAVQAKPSSKPAPAAAPAAAPEAADKAAATSSRQDKGRSVPDGTARWVPKPSDAGGRGDSPSSRPRRGSGSSTVGASKPAASAPKPVDSNGNAAASSNGVPVAAAPSPLPPNPSSALAAKAAAAPAGQQQQQHVAVQLPSSQAVNMAAVSSHNRSRNSSSGFGSSVAATSSGLGTNAYNPDGFGASFDAVDSFGAAFEPAYEPEQSSGSSSSHATAATTAKPAPASAHAAAPAPAHVSGPMPERATPAAPVAVPPVPAAAAAAPPTAAPAVSRASASAAHTSSAPVASTSAASQPSQVQGQQQVQDARTSVHTQEVAAPTASTSSKSTLTARHSGGGLSVNAPPFNPQLVPFQAGGYVTSSGPASNSSSRSGSIYSNQLEQQMFAGAVGSSATVAAAAAVAATAALSSSSGSGKAAASGGPRSSSTGGSSNVQWTSQPWSNWFADIAQAMQAHEQAIKQQQDQKDSKIREQQQQVDKERAARVTAEDKLAGLTRDLEIEKRRNKDLEDRLTSASTKADKLEASLAGLSAEYDRVLADAQAAAQDNAYLREQLAMHMQEKAGLESQLAEWKDSYNRTEQENKLMRDMLGPRAPAPHSQLSAETAGGRAPAAAAATPPPAAAGTAKQPPPGFGPMPAAQQRQPLAAAAAAAPPPQPQTPTFNAEQHMKNEHALVRILLSLLSEDPARALVWGEGEEAAVDAELLPLSWKGHYLPVFGDILTFMRQRPAVFGEITGAPYPMFFKQHGAEQKVNEAEEAERVAAAAAAAPAPWHMQGQQQQQGFGDAAGLMADQPGLMGPAAAATPDQQGGWSGHGMHASVPVMPSAAFPGLSVPFMAPHQGLMGHGMVPPMSMPMAPPSMPAVGQGPHHHQGMHPHHGW